MWWKFWRKTRPENTSDGVEHKSTERRDAKVWTDYDVKYAPIDKINHYKKEAFSRKIPPKRLHFLNGHNYYMRIAGRQPSGILNLGGKSHNFIHFDGKVDLKAMSQPEQ